MKALVVVLLLAACDKKPAPAPAAGSNTGSNPVVVVAPPIVDAIVVAPADASTVESSYGYCEAALTGADTLSMRVGFDPQSSWIRSDYWLSKAVKAKNGKIDQSLAQQGMTTENVASPIRVNCEAPLGSKMFIDFETSKLAKLKDIPEQPADFQMSEAEQKPNEIRVEVLLPGRKDGDSNRTLHGISGTLHVTAFKQGVFEANFNIDVASFSAPNEKDHLIGKIVFHCGDYDLCGE